MDLATANRDANSISVMLGAGDGTFAPPVFYAAGNRVRSIAVADFNGDGVADLATANYSSASHSVFLGQGDGTLLDGTSVSSGQFPRSVVTGD